MSKELRFFDIESYKYDYIVAFLKEDETVDRVFVNDTRGLKDYVKEYKIIAYNNYHYDDKMLTKMFEYDHPVIINGFSNRIIHDNLKIKVHSCIDSYDTMQEISSIPIGLKNIMANRGENIHETDIGFDIDRKLTPEELQREIDYCINDTKEVIKLWHERQDYFKAKENLVEMLRGQYKMRGKKPPANMIRWNTTTLVGNLFENPQPYIPKWRKFVDSMDVPFELKKFWTRAGQDIMAGAELSKEDKEFEIIVGDNTLLFGFGGLHGTCGKVSARGRIYHVDVASMYPNIIVALGVLGKWTQTYKDMIEERVACKKSDPERADTLKLILNKLYGILNNKYSAVYHPQSQMMVCVYGQTALYNLGLILEKSRLGKVLQYNTDGIYIWVDDNVKPEQIKELVGDWEKEYQLELDVDIYTQMHQRDVNNYIAVDEHGHIKTKGAIGRYDGDKLYANNSNPIVMKAVVDKLVNGVDIVDTITDTNNPIEFYQYIAKCGHTFKGIYDNDGNEYQKYNRVFAVKDGTSLYKVKEVDGKDQYNKLASAPESAKIINESVKGRQDIHAELDYNYYYQLAVNEYEQFVA